MRLSAFLIVFVIFVCTHAAHAQQKLSDGTDGGSFVANADAILELASKQKGLLHARVALVASNSPAPLSAHVAGMMVYNTENRNDVVAGIYYNNGAKWVLASAGSASNITYDPSTYLLSFTDVSGQPVSVDFKQVVKAHETVTTLVKNPNGTFTYKNEVGAEVTIDPGMVNVTHANGVYTFKDAEGNALATIDVNANQLNYDNSASGLQANSVQEAIDEIVSRLAADHINIIETDVNYMAKTNDAVILGDASTRDITIVLPTPTSANKGKKYTIKKEDTNEDGYVHVVGNISGVVSGLYTALPYSGWDLVSDGVSWRIVNKF
ncbi:hypothetical protein G5B00_13375 [Parapedobacter sp. SGR-10]|uniref:hypothetical protein n=1 Tax=Parapedobacter sp. SGR-10 TaxID=2710879 RepID=UPI0013D52A3B|nr:hypothetical protein [Parapedobacter sp. SGR-10]NGF57503.1 hypothetical protein [Parapedobacter sp. SGR-10]